MPSDDEMLVDQLVADCLARLGQGENDALAAVCREHPGHSEPLRRRFASLRLDGTQDPGTSQTGATVGSFRILRQLGAGGMGEVFLAMQTGPVRRLAALKLMRSRVAGQRGLARFDVERQALARLSHPNVAHIYESGATDDGRPWFAMEFVAGETITLFCRSHRLHLAARLQLFLQVCDAVQHAHQRGILHRDLKPGNVLVCEHTAPLVKVIDFGLAKTVEDPVVEASLLTEEGQVLGTPEYMSPEQAMPTEIGVDTRTDVYALGTILYELCTGVLPFDFVRLRQLGFAAVQTAICTEDAPAMSARLQRLGSLADPFAELGIETATLIRKLRGDLDWIAAKALAKDRASRYASVSELAADVRRHLAHQPVAAGPPSATYLLRKFVQRHRVGVTFAATGLAGLVIALAVSLELMAQTRASLLGFDTLQVVIDLEDLARRDDDELWPAVPQRAGAMAQWLDEARAIVGKLPAYREQLAALEARGEPGPQGWRFAAPRDAFLHSRLVPLVQEIGRLDAADGRIAAVTARLAWAAALRQLTIEGPAAAWSQAIAAIADRDQFPAYEGLRIAPQLGLVPLGRAPESGLYEFAFPQPGERLPERVDGRLAVADDTCMVFVLIAGEPTQLGLRYPDDRLPAELWPVAGKSKQLNDTEYEPLPEDPGKGRQIGVRLDPYFIAKHEMTQGQWFRLWQDNPSPNSPQRRGDYGITLAHPVGAVSWFAADRTMRRLGLELPTSAQWEHAARAGREGPWWTGFAREEAHGADNLADAAYSRRGGRPEFGLPDDVDDGFALTAPVDSLRANPFGLHHVIGNVREWCRDPSQKYASSMPRDGDGLMVPRSGEAASESMRDVRGGSFATAWLNARLTLRNATPANSASAPFGLRACRRLLPASE